jgi:hypothetical protein
MSIIHDRLASLNSHKRIAALMVGLPLVLASAPALAESYGAVKVECWGNCSLVNLGQVCDKYATGSIPIAVSCDDTASPGSGWASGCGNGATCTPYGSLYRSDLLSAYCADGGGNDAVVACRAP